MADPAPELTALREYVRETYKSLWDEIKFADAKATAIFFLSGAMLAAMIQVANTLKLPAGNECSHLVLKFFLVAGIVSFLCTAFFALATIVPRSRVDENSPKKENWRESFKTLFHPDMDRMRRPRALSTSPGPSAKQSAATDSATSTGKVPSGPKERFFQWIADYGSPEEFAADLKEHFGLIDSSKGEIAGFDRSFIAEVRRLSVTASRKYHCTGRSYTCCAAEALCLGILVILSVCMGKLPGGGLGDPAVPISITNLTDRVAGLELTLGQKADAMTAAQAKLLQVLQEEIQKKRPASAADGSNEAQICVDLQISLNEVRSDVQQLRKSLDVLSRSTATNHPSVSP